jgi:hypothetical protein
MSSVGTSMEHAALIERLREAEAALGELRRLGGDHLEQRWPGVAAMHGAIEDALSDPDSLADDAERARLVDGLETTLVGLYGGYGSFADYAIAGPEADRFERLKDAVRRLVGRLR